MKNILIRLLASVCLGINATAAPVVLDLSRSHTVENLKRSGLRVHEIAGGLEGQAYSFQNQVVEIRLPAGRSITQSMVLGTIDTKDGQLTKLSMHGDLMPLDQAVQIARMFHDNLGLNRKPLDKWEVQNRGKGIGGEPYSISANMNFYPRIGIGIKHSMNELYPWHIRLSLSWEWDEQREWDEARAWREFPPLNVAVLSLNPPSGRKYDGRDAYKEALEAQAKLEQEQAAKSGASPPTATASISQTPTATPSLSPSAQATKPSSVAGPGVSKSSHWYWIIGAVLLLVAACAALITSSRR